MKNFVQVITLMVNDMTKLKAQLQSLRKESDILKTNLKLYMNKISQPTLKKNNGNLMALIVINPDHRIKL